MALYSVNDRQDVLDYIVSIAKENEHITALIAVGSGAYGYNDELSDLDFVAAADCDESVPEVKEYLAAKIKERYKLLYFKQAPQIPLQVYILDNFLEIDIGFGAYKGACAFKAHWNVLFDKSGTVDAVMQRTWDCISSAPMADRYNAKLAESADIAWHSLMHTAVAIKRKNYWRAAGELDFTRNLLIELLGMRYSLETARGKDTDKLPEAERTALEKTLVKSLDANALWASLDALTDAFYNELEQFGAEACIKLKRSLVNEFIGYCKKL